MPSNTDPKTILLSGSPSQQEAVTASGSAIKPGMLVEVTSAGELQEHSTAGGNAQASFAREEDYVGGGIDDAYAVGDTAPYYICKNGDRIYGFIADGENISEGDLLESDGNGVLQAHTPQAVDEGGAATYTIYNEAIVGRATEDVNNSAGGAIARIKIEVL